MDDRELKKLLEENLKISQESLKIMKKLNRARMWGRFFFLLKWGLIFGVLIFGLIKVQPYLATFSNNVDRFSNLLNDLSNFLPKN
ncbi:MAG: hypothetical protein HY445_01550 [Candidatus Niyogibacteria bacterium]|nr:hypothetical protein [Candidatus Niyogibacteria bacterium]